MNIILIGFMGAGKSSVAQILSEKLHLQLIELDEIVLKKSGRKSINEIFARDGETAFRELEIEAAKSLQSLDNLIISSGGGIVHNKLILDYLKKDGTVIFLETPLTQIEKRLVGDKTRPLFQDKKKTKKLFNFRKKLYEEYADIIVSTGNKTQTEVAGEIIKLLCPK